MEILLELLAPLLEIFAEALLQLAFEWLAEIGFRAIRAPFQRSTESRPETAAIGYAIFGAAAGGLSLFIFPSSFVHSYGARVANLIATPILCGASMSLFGAWRRRRGQELMRLDRFAYGMVFAFAMAVVRFVFARHA